MFGEMKMVFRFGQKSYIIGAEESLTDQRRTSYELHDSSAFSRKEGY